jgi:hypothetical protein
MSCYSIPAMTMQNEFSNLVWVGRYVDGLIDRTKDLDYGIVYEWGVEGPGDWPPIAVLTRVDGQWSRRETLVTIRQNSDGTCFFHWELDQSGAVNGH